MILIYTILILLLSLFMHELGHYVVMVFFGYKPKLKLSSFLIITFDIKSQYSMQLKEMWLVAYMGIFVGMIPIVIIPDYMPWYIVSCMMDIATMLKITKATLKTPRKTMFEFTQDNYFQLKRLMGE